MTCYGSLCASATAVSTSGSPVVFESVLASFTSPYFEKDKELDFSIVGSWRVPAFVTNFDIKIKGTMAITVDSVTADYEIFEYSFNTLTTAENTK